MPDGLSRRTVLARGGLLAAAAIVPLPRVAERLGLLDVASASADAVIRDTLGGVVAYVVPGNDRYSIAQGESTHGPGGIAAGAVEELRSTLAIVGPGVTEATVGVLNAMAGTAQTRGFASPFAALSFAGKDRVFSMLAQSHDATMRELASTIPAIVAFLSYSEAGALDKRTGRLTRVPVGWRLTGYTGVADIRNELRGYYGGRRKALGG